MSFRLASDAEVALWSRVYADERLRLSELYRIDHARTDGRDYMATFTDERARSEADCAVEALRSRS